RLQRQLQQHLHVLPPGFDLIPFFDFRLQLLLAAGDLLGRLGIVPEVGRAHALFQLLGLRPLFFYFKGSHPFRGCACLPRVAAPDLLPRPPTPCRILPYLALPQQCLYFFPLPHGHGSLRPIFCATRRGCSGAGCALRLAAAPSAATATPPPGSAPPW